MSPPASAPPSIMIVEDEVEVLEGFELILNSAGFPHILPCTDSRQVLPLLRAEHHIQVILLDLLMPHIKGAELLPRICERFPHIPVIVVTALDEIETAVSCMKAGAFDYLVKPVEKVRLVTCVRRAFERLDVQRENMALRQQILSDTLNRPEAFEDIITRHPGMMAIFKYIEAIAPSSEPVLISGETGVGKELIARAIHKAGSVKGPFIAVNTAGLDDQSFSDVLFGHTKGAFTGADKPREGLVKKAAGGTLFLDEISDTSPNSQVKLLRLLQEKEYFRLGSDQVLKSSARILAASNRDLEKAIRDGRFRSDLYFRLKTHQITLPPLRSRSEDLPLLIRHFLRKGCSRLGKTECRQPDQLLRLLRTYPFPGNIRELKSMVYDAVSAHISGPLSLDRFEKWIGQDSLSPAQDTFAPTDEENPFTGFSTLPTLHQAARLLVREAMQRSGNNQSLASRILGISQPALSKRLKNAEKS